MDTLPREILYTIVEYLRPPEYINLAIADKYCSDTINRYFKTEYSALLYTRDYKCCSDADIICNKCRYIYCNNCQVFCPVCDTYECPDCTRMTDYGCYKCTFEDILDNRVRWCRKAKQFNARGSDSHYLCIGQGHALIKNRRELINKMRRRYPDSRTLISEWSNKYIQDNNKSYSYLGNIVVQLNALPRKHRQDIYNYLKLQLDLEN